MPKETDIEFLKNYKSDTLYVRPTDRGSFATIVGENEELIGDFAVSETKRIAVKAFYVNGKKDFNSFEILKFKKVGHDDWCIEGNLKINKFDVVAMETFVQIISSLDLSDGISKKIDLGKIGIQQLDSILNSSLSSELLNRLSNSKELKEDVYAVASKRVELKKFSELIAEKTSEPKWQAFFEDNPWIFGHGLNYVFLSKAGNKLETCTSGSAFDRFGNRADGLLRTNAEVSQYVLLEIKRADTDLLKKSSYRTGAWAVSHEVSDAVTQVQKTTFDFAQNRLRDVMKDELGNDTEEVTYAVQPKSYLVIGNSKEISGNSDKIACFELYRKNLNSPEILTFDELYHRASCILDNIEASTTEKYEDIPF